MRNSISDFVLDSQGHCFLCLSQIKCSSSPSTIHSLQYLSRHLKLDMGKVFRKQKRPIPPHLLAKVMRSRLKVELCEGCGATLDRFSQLYGQLEKLKMEVDSCVKTVHETLTRSRAAGEEERFVGRVAGIGWGDLEAGRSDLVEMVGVLRTETMEKCSKELRSSLPRIRIPVPATPKNRRMVTGSGGAPQVKTTWVDGRCGKRDRKSIRWSVNPATGKRRCNLCPYEFNTAPAFHFHYKMAHLHIRYGCDKCGKQFPYKSSLYLHIRSVHMKVRYKCHRCHKKFTQTPQLAKHYRESDCKPPRVVKTEPRPKAKDTTTTVKISPVSKGQSSSPQLDGTSDFDLRRVKMERFHEAILPDSEGEEGAPSPNPLGMVSAVLEGLGIM